VEAFARVSAGTNAHLVLIGPDFEGGRQFLSERAGQLGCEEKIRFAGSQVDAAKWGILKMADAFVFPSRWEAFAIALAEAAGIGLPSIVSDRIHYARDMGKANAALVSPFSAGSLAESMRRVMTDLELRRTLAEGGRRWVRQTCSAGQAGPRFEGFYQAVAEAGA
jgi:glycosyltransferase involved in cell wall biosynthesis